MVPYHESRHRIESFCSGRAAIRFAADRGVSLIHSRRQIAAPAKAAAMAQDLSSAQGPDQARPDHHSKRQAQVSRLPPWHDAEIVSE